MKVYIPDLGPGIFEAELIEAECVECPDGAYELAVSTTLGPMKFKLTKFKTDEIQLDDADLREMAILEAEGIYTPVDGDRTTKEANP